jgi:hypothetical protein
VFHGADCVNRAERGMRSKRRQSDLFAVSIEYAAATFDFSGWRAANYIRDKWPVGIETERPKTVNQPDTKRADPKQTLPVSRALTRVRQNTQGPDKRERLEVVATNSQLVASAGQGRNAVNRRQPLGPGHDSFMFSPGGPDMHRNFTARV